MLDEKVVKQFLLCLKTIKGGAMFSHWDLIGAKHIPSRARTGIWKLCSAHKTHKKCYAIYILRQHNTVLCFAGSAIISCC